MRDTLTGDALYLPLLSEILGDFEVQLVIFVLRALILQEKSDSPCGTGAVKKRRDFLLLCIIFEKTQI